MKRYFLIIDQGTTSSRVVIYKKNFEIFDIVQKEFKQFFPNEGWVEHDANEIRTDVKYLITQALKKNKNSRLLVRTWKNATWAIRFQEKFGFITHSKDETNLLLKKYWKIPSKQIDNSIVLEKA